PERGVDGARVGCGGGASPVPADLKVSADVEQLVITTEKPLAAGDAVLELRFDGEISQGLLGFYRSTYIDEAGARQVLAATQFEAPHARAAFPCFDEPEFKATFAITLVVADGLLALSNGPQGRPEKVPGGYEQTRLAGESTVSMTT